MLTLIFQTVGCDIKLKLRENFYPQDSYVCGINLFYFYLLEKLLNNEVKARYILQDINFNIPEYWSTIVEFCISQGFDTCLVSLSLVTFSHASCDKNQHKLFLRRYFYCNKKRGMVHSNLQEPISKYCSFILYSTQDVFKECKAKLSECDLNAVSEYTSIIQCLIIDIIGSNCEKECKVVNKKISSTLLNILLILLSTVIEGTNFYKLQKILTTLLNLVVKVYHMMDNIYSSYGILIDNNSILHKITLLLSYKYVFMLSKETISGFGHILAYFLYTLYYFEVSSTITNSIDISSGTNREDITDILSKYLYNTSNIGLMATYRGFVILLSRLGASDQLYKSTFEAAFYLFIKFITTTDESYGTNLEKIYALQSLLVLLSSIRSIAHKSKKFIDVLFFTKNHMKTLVKTIFYIWDYPNNYYTAQVCLIWDELVKLLVILNDLPTIHWLVYLVLNYYWLDAKYQFYSLQSIFSCLITNKDFVEELTSSNIKDEFYNFSVKPFLNIYESEPNSKFENQFLLKLLFSLSVNHLFSSALRLLKTWIKICLKMISNKKDEYKVFTNILKVSFNIYYETRYDKVGDLDYLSYRNKISNFIFSIMQEKYITCDYVDLYKLLSRYITKDEAKRCKLDAIQIMLLLHAQRCEKVAWKDELDKSTQFSQHLYSNIVLFNENQTVEISYKQFIRTLVSSETNNIIKLIDFLVQKFKFYCTSKKSWKLIEVNNVYLIRELEYLYLLIYLGRTTNTEEFKYLLNSLYKVFNLIKKLLPDSVNWEVKVALNYWLYKLYRYLVSSIGLYMPYDRYTRSLSILKIYLSSVDFGISCSTSLIDNNKWISDKYSINLTLYYKLLSLTTITSLNSKKFIAYELLLNYQFYFGDSIYIAETQLIDKNEYYLKRIQILRKMLYSRRPKDYRACCIYICCLIKRSKGGEVLDNLANVLDIPMNFEDMRGKSIYLQLINALFNSIKEKVDILNSNNIFEEFNSVKFNGLIVLLGTLTDLFKIEIFEKDKKYFDCKIDEYCIVLGLIKQCLVLLINMTKVISTIRRYNGMESFIEEQEIRVKDIEVDTWKTFEECCNTVRTFLQNYSLEQLFYNSRCIYSPSNSSIHDYILYIDFLDLLGISYINIILQCNHTGMVDRACEILLIICNSLTNKKLLNKKGEIIETQEEEYVKSYDNEIYFTSEITIELSNVCNLPLFWLFDIIDRIFYADYKRAREFKTITFDLDLINNSYSEYLNGCTFHKVSVDNQYTKSTWERCTKREGYIGQDKAGIPKLHREQISEIPSPVRKSDPLCKIIGILFSSLMVDSSNIPILSILIKIFLLGNEFSTLQVTPNKQGYSNLISINMKFTPIYCNHIIASLLLDSNLNKISSFELFDANLICGILLTTGRYIDNNVNTKEGKWLECNTAVNLLSSLIKKIGKGNKADKYILNKDSNKRNDHLKFCEFYSCNKSKYQCGLDTANCFSYSLSYLNRSFKGLKVFVENILKNSRNLYFIGMMLIFLSEVSIIWSDCSVSLIITIMSLINNKSYYIRLYASRLLTNIIFNSSNRNECFDIEYISKSKVTRQQYIGTIMNYIHLEDWLYELFEILVNTSKLCLNILITKIRRIVCLIENHLSNSSKLNYNLIHGMLLLCIEIMRRPGVSCNHKETIDEQNEVISEANIALQVICNKILGRYFCSSPSYKVVKTVFVELCDLLIHIIFDIYGDVCTNILAVDSVIISLNLALAPNIQNNIFDVICSRVYLVHLLEVNKYDELLDKLQADFKRNPKCLHPSVLSELYRTLYKYTNSGIYHPINNNRNISSEFANFLLSLIEFHMQELTLFDLSLLQMNMEVKILKYYTDFLIYIIKLLNNVQSYLSDFITYWDFSSREKYYYILYYIVVGMTKLCDINYNTKYHTPYFGILNINSKLLMNYLLFIVKHYDIIEEIFRKRDESYIVLFWYEDILIRKFLTLLYSNNVSYRNLITSILYSSKSRYILCIIIGEMLNIDKSKTNKLVIEAENNQSTFNKLVINLIFLLMDEILEVRLKSLEIARGYFEIESCSLNNFSFDNAFLCIEELCSKRFTINLLLELMDALFNRIFYISDLGYSHMTKSDIFPFEIDNISNEYIYVSEIVSRKIVHNIENSISIYSIMGQLKKCISRWINEIGSDTKIAAIIECININKNCKELIIFEIFGTILLQDTDIYLFMLNLSKMRVIKAYLDVLDNNIQDHSEIMEYTVTQIIEIIDNLEFVLLPMYIK